MRHALAGAVLAGALAGPVFAAGEPTAAASDFILLLQIGVLILVGRGLGELMQRIGQPSVMGQLIAGILLGPSVFGALWPAAQHALFPPSAQQKAMLDGIAQFGILLLLLLTGMETDLKLVRRIGRAAATVSVAGICVPFVCGFVLGQFIPAAFLPRPEQRLFASLFLGIALSISSVKIVAMVVREMNFMRRNIGQIIVASAVIDDAIGWIIIAIVFSLASHASLDVASLARSILGTAAFLAVSLTIGRRIVFKVIRLANDNLASEAPVITVILVLMVAMALITQAIGVHTVLGAFVAGILVGESPILTRQIDSRLRSLITSLFMPVFFGLAGLSTDLTILRDPTVLLLTGGLILIASLGKFAGAFIGGEFGGLTHRESLALACGMNARGSTEVIVASIGLAMGILSRDLFTMIVAMAIITTMAMPPMLRAALARLPIGAEEEARLEREAFEQKGFVANIERILIAVDDSANGRFASRLAGLVAGARGIPTTVLHIGDRDERAADRRADTESPEAAVKAGAEVTAAAATETEKQKPAEVEVTTRTGRAEPQEAVADEARKGFDFMLIGVGEAAAGNAFAPDVERAAAGFEGPLGVVIARGHHLEQPRWSRFKILVPVSGTLASRRGAEVAVALARANDMRLTALYIAGAAERERRGFAISATLRHEEAIMKDLVDLAERYDTEVTTIVRPHATPDEAILREVQRQACDLIVMGVNRRPGDALFFGHAAAAVLEKSKVSILFVST